MKKKIVSIVCILAMAMGVMVGLTACGGENNNNTTQTATQPATTQEAGNTQTATPAADVQTSVKDAFTFTFKGTDIRVNDDAAPILEALGECKSYTEETSCAFDGLDKNYTYTSFVLTTYPDGDKDRVNSVTLRDDTVSTSDGISIGDAQDKVEEVYGTDAFNGVNAYIIDSEAGDARLQIILTSGKVSSIQYIAVFE